MFLRLLMLSAVILSFSAVTAHADEFGARFQTETPKGLAAHTYDVDEAPAIAMDNAAEELNQILPASGDEDVVAEIETKIDSKVDNGLNAEQTNKVGLKPENDQE